MKTRTAFGSIVMMFVLALPVYAGGKGELQQYFSNIANKVKATEKACEKRKILDESFQDISKSLETVQNLSLISKEDQVGINQLKATLKEKQDELAGKNGYQRVSDNQLNNFSDYVVQDMEQAATMVTISLVALVIIILAAVLLF
jgi:hypothetical protein